MADEIRRWSEELARDPSSLVFLRLGEALRRQGELDVALKFAQRGVERHPRNVDAHDLVARISVDRRDLARAFDEWQATLAIVPDHVGAMKGLGYVCFQQGRLDEAERYLNQAAAGGAGTDVSGALATVRRSTTTEADDQSDDHIGDITYDETVDRATDRAADSDSAIAPMQSGDAPTDPQWMFVDLLLDDTQTALLLDAHGLVLGGIYIDADGDDVSQEVGARLSGISDEVVRAARYLDLGEWRSMTFETEIAVVAMAPAADASLIVVAASRATPLGLIRRLLDRCAERAAGWLGGRVGGAGKGARGS